MYDMGVTEINEAIILESEGNLSRAAIKFQSGIEKLMKVLKEETNAQSKVRLISMIEEYISRVEQIQEAIGPQNVLCAKTNKNHEIIENQIEQIVQSGKSTVNWSSIFGLDLQKQILIEAAMIAFTTSNSIFTTSPWNGILLYGAPGTGKTTLVKSLGSKVEGTLYNVLVPELLITCTITELGPLLRNIFQLARVQLSSIIFFDELDSISSFSNNVLHQELSCLKTSILIEMNSTERTAARVLTLAATNNPWNLDIGIRRIFDKRVYVDLPDTVTRMMMFAAFIDNNGRIASEDEMKLLVERTESYTVHEINKIFLNSQSNFQEIIDRIDRIDKPCHKIKLERYKKWTQDFSIENLHYFDI